LENLFSRKRWFANVRSENIIEFERMDHWFNVVCVDFGEQFYQFNDFAKFVRQLHNFSRSKGKPSKVSNTNHIFGG